MAATSLLRLVFIFLILIALALSSNFAWGSLAVNSDRDAIYSTATSPTAATGAETTSAN